jgi:hypothetical protein
MKEVIMATKLAKKRHNWQDIPFEKTRCRGEAQVLATSKAS